MATEFFTEIADDSGGVRGQLSVAVDSANTPWIVYVTESDEVMLARRAENEWVTEKPPCEGAARDLYRVSLALDSALRPHIAYQSAATDHLIYGVRDEAWNFEEVPTDAGLFPSRVRFPFMRLNPGLFDESLLDEELAEIKPYQDIPHFSYQSGLALWHAAKQPPRTDPKKPPTWRKHVEKVEGSDGAEKGWFTCLTLDHKEKLRIASFDDLSALGQSVRRLRLATMTPGTDFPGQPNSWQVEVLHGDQVLGEFPDMAHSITEEGVISYYERNAGTLNVCMFGNFPESPAIEAVTNEVDGEGMHSAAGVSHESRFCVAYGSGGKLKLATRTGIGTFVIEDVESGGKWADMVVDSEGNMHFAHVDGGFLKYALAPRGGG